MELNKKGSFMDLYWVLYAIFAAIIFVLFLPSLLGPAYEVFGSLGSDAVDNIINTLPEESIYTWVDYMLVGFYVALNLGAIVLAAFVPFNSMLYGLFYVFSFIYLYVVALFSDILYDFAVLLSSPFGLTNYIIEYMVMLQVLFMAIMGVVVFFKPRDQDSGMVVYR